MDPHSNTFEPVKEDEEGVLRKEETGEAIPPDWTVFTLGEEIGIRGYLFRVDAIAGSDITLRGIRSLKKSKTEKNRERRKRNKQKQKKKRK